MTSEYWEGDPPSRPDQTPIAPGRFPAPPLSPEWQDSTVLVAWLRELGEQGCASTSVTPVRGVVPAAQDEPDGSP